MKKIIEVNDGCRRLDHYLASVYKNTPKSHIQKIIRKGVIRVNGIRARHNAKLHVGDEVVMPEPEQSEQPRLSPSLNRLQHLNQSVLQENDDWLIINKSDRSPVHSGTGHCSGIIDDICHLRQSTYYLVHRLDRQTSGVLILAKHMRAKLIFDDMFKQRHINKFYEAVISACPSKTGFECRLPLKKVHTADGSRSCYDQNGQSAHTLFHVYRQKRYTRLKIELLTGRFHQIRSHLSLLKMPILGDRWYAGDDFIDGLMLHASKVEFMWNGKRITQEAQWPAKKKAWLDREGLCE